MFYKFMLSFMAVVMALMGIVEKERLPNSIYWFAVAFIMCTLAVIEDA